MAKGPTKSLAQLARERADRAAANAAAAAEAVEKFEREGRGGDTAAHEARVRAGQALEHAQQLARAADDEEEAESRRGGRQSAARSTSTSIGRRGSTAADLPRMSAADILAAMSEDQRAGIAARIGIAPRTAPNDASITNTRRADDVAGFAAGFAAATARMETVMAADGICRATALALLENGPAALSAEEIIGLASAQFRRSSADDDGLAQVLAENWVNDTSSRDACDEPPPAFFAAHVERLEARLGITRRRQSSAGGDHGWGAARARARQLTSNPVAAAHAARAQS